MQNFRNLRVWQAAHVLVLSTYKVTRVFPREEQFALTSQIRRAAISIPANIAEGCGRGTDSDFARFLQIAVGSATELEYHLLLAADLCFLSREVQSDLGQRLIEVRRMLVRLALKLKPSRGRKFVGGARPIAHSS